MQEAYKLLKSNESSDEYKGEPYKDVLNAFLSSIFKDEQGNTLKIINLIRSKICDVIDKNVEHIVHYLRTINRDTLKIVRDVLSNYKHILHFSAELLDKIDEILEVDECIVLNPTLEDLMSDENVYILKHEDRSYLVPLWHHEITFEHKENINIVVKNYPVLPDHVELDEYNTLTIHLQYNARELWDNGMVFNVCGKQFILFGNELRLTSVPQRLEYPDCGIPYNNLNDVLDASKKQSIVFMVTILQSYDDL